MGLAAHERLHGVPSYLVGREHEQHPDEQARERLVLGMAVRMVAIGRTGGDDDARQTYDVSRRIEEGMDAVGAHGFGRKRAAADDLRQGDA